MIKPTVELLAPASNFQSVVGAIQAGADAVYIGGPRFGARAYADNPDEDNLKKTLDFVHLHGKQLYLTINTLLKENELTGELISYLTPYYERGLDAVIVQDIGVLNVIRRTFPDLPVHASTQMTITGKYGAEFLQGLGVKRVVTARELSMQEIKEIKSTTQLEIESFIHGALCYCYSGQCFFSSFIGGRSGNRGRCAQPCRLPYKLCTSDDARNCISKGNAPYLLSPKDISTITILPDIIEAGVYSLKIEGRMKRPEYVAGVTSIYRKYLNIYLEKGKTGYVVDEADKQILLDLYNRGGFHTGYYKEHNGKNMMSMERPNHNGVYAGSLSLEKKHLTFTPVINIKEKDVLEIRNISKKPYEFVADNNYYPEKSYLLSENIRNNTDKQFPLPVFRTKNESLLKQLNEKYIASVSRKPITGCIKITEGKPIELEVNCSGLSIRIKGAITQSATNRPLTEEELRKQLNKTGNTPFFFEHLTIIIEGNCFISIKELNQVRREALEQLEQKLLQVSWRKTKVIPENHIVYKEHPAPSKVPELFILAEQFDHIKPLLALSQITGFYLSVNAFENYSVEERNKISFYSNLCHQANKRFYLVLPDIFRKETVEQNRKIINSHLHELDGIVIKNIEEYMFLKQFELPEKFELITDYTIYTMNHEAQSFWENHNISKVTLPVELNKTELRELATRHIVKQECILYGYLPMMVSAQCLVKNTGTCQGKQQKIQMIDRMGKSLYVKNNCKDCYNIIYNSQPLSLLGLEQEIYKLQPDSVRLNFTVEKPDEALLITKAFIRQFYEQKESSIPLTDFTRGHFKRGVE